MKRIVYDNFNSDILKTVGERVIYQQGKASYAMFNGELWALKRVEGEYVLDYPSHLSLKDIKENRFNPSKRKVIKRTVSDWDNCEHCAETGILRKGFPMAGMARMDGGTLYLCRSCARKELNPSKRRVLKRVGAALKKWMRGNPSRVKGRKVKGGRAVTLKNMKTITVTRHSNGVVSVRGVQLRGRKR